MQVDAAAASPTRGIFFGGYVTAPTRAVNNIHYITTATTGNAQDFGDMTIKQYANAACSNSIRAVSVGGNDYPNLLSSMEFVTIATKGNSTSFGSIAATTTYPAAASSPTRGVIAGGNTPTHLDTIQYIYFATEGDAVDFGDLTQARNQLGGLSNANGGL